MKRLSEIVNPNRRAIPVIESIEAKRTQYHDLHKYTKFSETQQCGDCVNCVYLSSVNQYKCKYLRMNIYPYSSCKHFNKK